MMFACLYRPPSSNAAAAGTSTGDELVAIARDSSPRYQIHGNDLVVIDIAGLERLLGPPRVIGAELRRAIATRGVRAHVAIASTQTAAILLAMTRPGLTIVERGAEAGMLATVAIGILGKSEVGSQKSEGDSFQTSDFVLQTFAKWGVSTLGELAALPASDLVARFGRQSLGWQAVARGEDLRPLVPSLDEERFESTLELEWPIEGLEPLSFVLTRLLEPLSTRLERRDRGAAVLHVLLRLVTREAYARRLELPTPMRDVRALRTLALLDLESHPPAAAIDRVTIVIDPTPGRVLQHTLFTRAHPAPEQLSTLLARLGALLGQDRIGAPATVDTYRPGAFEMTAFRVEHDRAGGAQPFQSIPPFQPTGLLQAVRRCRQPVPARVAVADGRPVRVTTDRRGFAGGAVVRSAGPWRTSGDWWAGGSGGSGKSGGSGDALPIQTFPTLQTVPTPWSRDEWDVALADGAIYRIFQDRHTDGWFIDAVMD